MFPGRLKYTIVTAIFFAVFLRADASHIVGGDFTYKRLSGNQFEVTLKLFRDCESQAPFDARINIGIFEQNSNTLLDSLEILIDSVYSVALSMPGTQCAPPPDICVEAGVYIDTLTLVPNPAGYYISWQRCCRNGGIINLNNGIDTGIAFYMEIPDPSIINNSPIFDFEPLPYVCEEQPFSFDYSATDADGDVLVYSIAEPLAGTLGHPVSNPPSAVLTYQIPGPYPVVDWNPGFSLGNMFGSNVPLTIDNNTGIMNAQIDMMGHYAVAVEVREYRNGVQIGLIRREIEINCIICWNQAPELTPVNTATIYDIYETDSLCMTFTYTDADTNNVVLTVDGNVLGGSGTTPPFATATEDSANFMVTSDFCWKTVCGQGREDPYYLVYTVVDDGCPLPFTTIDSIIINVNPMPVFERPNVQCARLIDANTLKIVWIDNSIQPAYFDNYTVYRSVNGGPFVQHAIISNDTVRSYTDATALNNSSNDYCYYVQSFNKCNVGSLFSDTICSVSQMNSKQNYIEYVTVLDDRTLGLKWEHFPGGPYSTFYLYSGSNDGTSSFQLERTLQYPTTDSIIMSGLNTGTSSYCYYLQNADWCGNLSEPSNIACSIHLEGEEKPLVNFIDWNEYVNWKGSVDRYEVMVSKGTNSSAELLFTTPSVVTEHYDELPDPDYGTFTYQIVAYEGPGGSDATSRSNEVTLDQIPFIYVPNAFTPNGDGRNDTWGISTNYVKDGKVTVYNRWGQVVFSGTVNESWDGSFSGAESPAGVYIYRVEYTGFSSGLKEISNGMLHLIR